MEKIENEWKIRRWEDRGHERKYKKKCQDDLHVNVNENIDRKLNGKIE